MWILIVLAIIGIIGYSFYSDTQKVKHRNLSLGGLKTLFSDFATCFEAMDMELVEDTGTNLLYKKKLTNNQYANTYYFIGIESKFENLAYGYVLFPDGKKIKSSNYKVYNNYTLEEMTKITMSIYKELTLKGAFL